jgi:hypothetical protein
LRRDGARPLITWYAEGDAGRVELSVATTANWVAKTAGYLVDELDISAKDPIIVAPTLHWITAVALLAAWAAGARVVTDVAGNGERIELPLDPMGGGLSRLVAGFPDSFVPVEPSGGGALSVAPDTIPDGARVLTTLPLDSEGMGWGLLAPLAAAGSVVYAADAPALAERAAAERVTHTVGIDLPGLPRLA